MRSRALATLVLLAPLVACAHASRAPEAAADDATPSGHADRAPSPMPETAFEEPAPAPRPRLSRTITLGQGEAAYTEARPPTASGSAPAGGTTVIVNNQVVVPPSYGVGYGYGYGYGYGPSFGGARAGRSDVAPSGFGTGSYSSANPPGWEGARRTAAPGQTPGVGGNWAPAPSYGPAPMR